MDGIRVTATQKIEQLGDGGFPFTVYRVNYVTERGARGVFTIPEKDFTAERLPEVLSLERDKANLAFDIANGD